MKALIHNKFQAMAALWVTLMALSLAAQDGATRDQPAEPASSESTAETVFTESGTPFESSATTEVDPSQSGESQPSEDLSTTEVVTEVEESQIEEKAVTTESQAITIESGVIKIEQTQGEPEVPAPPAAPEPPPEKKQWKSLEEVVRIFADGVVGPNEVSDDFVVIGGQGVIEGMVDGDGVVVLGNAVINGKVDGDFVNVLGTTTLGPNAEIEGELVVIGGRLIQAEGAETYGGVKVITFLPDFAHGHFKWVHDWFRSGLLMGRPLPHDQSWAWIAAGVLLLVSLLISLIFRRAVDSTAQVLESRPAAALLTGMLIFVLSGPLNFILTVSVVGILIIPFFMAGLVAAGVFGIISVYRFSGQQLGLGSIPALALLAGGAIFTLLYAVPFVGFLVWFLAATLGTGAVFLALVKGLKGESKRDRPAKVPMSPIAPSPIRSAQPLTAGTTETQTESTTEGTAITATPDDPLMAERVGFWPRLGATALDFVLIALLVSFTGLDSILPFAWLGYHIAFWTWRQTTIGGIVLNLKVVRLDGQPLNFGVVAIRSVSSIFSGLVVGLGFFWASWDDERQSWHDKIAGTTIIRVPKGTSLL